MAAQSITQDRCALVATFPTQSAAWLASARIAAASGPETVVFGGEGDNEGVNAPGIWGVYAVDTYAAHTAQSSLCAVTDHGRLDSRGTGWWHAAGVTRHLVCIHCGAGRHGDGDRPLPRELHAVWGGDYQMHPCHCPMSPEEVAS